jgi:hypothetical protein
LTKKMAKPTIQMHWNNLQLQDLMGLIQSLSAGYRTVFNFYVIEGLFAMPRLPKNSVSVKVPPQSQLARARYNLTPNKVNKSRLVAKENIR